jgi:hypothetical protein
MLRGNMRLRLQWLQCLRLPHLLTLFCWKDYHRGILCCIRPRRLHCKESHPAAFAAPDN